MNLAVMRDREAAKKVTFSAIMWRGRGEEGEAEGAQLVHRLKDDGFKAALLGSSAGADGGLLPSPPPKIWSGTADVGLNGATGNSELFNLTIGYTAVRKTADNIFTNNFLYTNATQPYFRAPQIYLAFPKRYVPSRFVNQGVTDGGVSEAVFMSSRDGVHWNRFLEAFIRPGREMLFSRVDTEAKYKAKNLIDVPVYRGGDALSAQVKSALEGGGLSTAGVALLGAGLAAVWALNGWWLGRQAEKGPAPGSR